MRTNLITILSILLGLSTSLTSFAAPSDIIGEGDKYIRVTKKENTSKFELCSRSQKHMKCRLLGDRAYYHYELEDLQTKLECQMAGTAIPTALAAAAAVYLTIKGVILLAGTGLVEVMLTTGDKLSILATMAATATASTYAFTSKWAPWNIYNRRMAVKDDVIKDKDFKIKGGDAEMEKMANLLHRTLREI